MSIMRGHEFGYGRRGKFTLSVPPTSNHLYRINTGDRGQVRRMFMTKAARDWKRLSSLAMLGQTKLRNVKYCSIEVIMNVDYRTDIQNRTKLLLDTMQDIKIIVDDRYVEEITVCRYVSGLDKNQMSVSILELIKC